MLKAVVLGIEGLNPELFRQWLDDLPNIEDMQDEGVWGTIESVVPPAVPQAWISMQSGQNPGVFGVWGNTYRDAFSYKARKKVDSTIVSERVACLYKLLPHQRGQKVALLNVPATWPIPQIPGGYCISDTVPERDTDPFTWPTSLKKEIQELAGEYAFDIDKTHSGYWGMDEGELIRQVYAVDEQRFALLKYFYEQKQCDYIFSILSGGNILYKVFNRSPEEILRQYYTWIDQQIGEFRDILDGETVLLVLSAFSNQQIEGALHLNEWLLQQGYLALREYPKKPIPFDNTDIDWTKTQCWAMGETGNIYINLKGRETQGIVEPEHYDVLLDELSENLKKMTDTEGGVLASAIIRREDIHFGKYADYGPDLFVSSPCNLTNRVGYGKGNIYSSDSCEASICENHGASGYFCIAGSDFPASGKIDGISLLHIAPTVMDILRLDIPYMMEKPSILSILKRRRMASKKQRTTEVKESVEDAAIKSRLEALGY